MILKSVRYSSEKEERVLIAFLPVQKTGFLFILFLSSVTLPVRVVNNVSKSASIMSETDMDLS